MKSIKNIIIIVLCLFLIPGVFIAAKSTWFLERTVDVAQKELDPQELLRKYDWLKSAQASLDAKLSTIEVDNGKIKAMETSYAGVARNQWAETDAVQYNQWQAERDGVKASYNNLAAEYNTRMSEVHWSFSNVGGVPKGRTGTLPKEYREYITQ